MSYNLYTEVFKKISFLEDFGQQQNNYRCEKTDEYVHASLNLCYIYIKNHRKLASNFTLTPLSRI